MSRFLSTLAAGLLLGCLVVPVAAQSLGLDMINTRRELSGRLWGSGSWIAFTIDEDEKDLNGDNDIRDTILCLSDMRTGNIQETGLAITYSLADTDSDWPVAISGDQVAVQVSEADNGGKDLNGNGTNNDDALALYNPRTRQAEYIGAAGRNPVFLGTKLYFVQPESAAKKDLNGDGDLRDQVLCSYDTTTRQHESLGMEAANGFHVAGDWIATETSEASQFARDLNDDKDLGDTVIQLYQISTKKWTNTHLAMAADVPVVLTSRLAAFGVLEVAQGDKDLNNDMDDKDAVCHVWDLAAGEATNTGVDCSGGLGADGTLVGFAATERSQGNKDLNGDMDSEDVVAFSFSLATKRAVSLKVDASGSLAVGGGKILISCGELDQNSQDLNRDKDTDDYVLLVYDPISNKVTNTAVAVDGDLVANEGTLAWKVLEGDQFDRDLNRDGDTDDLILCVMDLATGSYAATGWACGDYVCPTSRGVGFACLEEDQGSRDLNGDKDTDDEIVQLARKKAMGG